ncbi:hypothetical protein QYF36_010230 [Acer negundo]|nr:hypothetical protein QYF36_010230 [Acer negundo]
MGESSSENKDDGSLGKHEEENEEMIRTKPGSLRMVLKDSDWKDVLLMVMGSIGSVADGSAMALIMLCLGSLMNGYGSSALTLHDINKYAMSLLYVAVGVGSGAFLEGFCWARTAERQTLRLRRRYLGAVLRQDVGFFDTNHGASMTSQVVSSISTDTLTIQGVLTEKIANFLMHMSTFITGQLVALYLSWRLAIVAIPALSMLIIPGLVYGKLLGGVGEEIQEAYAIAGGIVEQTISSMRTVYSYVAEDRMLKSYKIALEPTLKLGIKQGLLKGMAMGSIGITFAVWALQGWYGSTLVKKNAKGGNVFTAGVCIVYAGLSLGGALINVKYLIEANVAASRIFEMIHRFPNIDSEDQQGITVLDVKVIQSGEVVESGFHDELMGRGGSYSGMVQLQRAIISDDNASTTKSMESNTSDFLDKGTPRTADMQISSHDKITNQLQEDPKGSPSLWYLMCMTVSEWKSTVLGCIGGVCYGMIQPLYSFCLGGLLSVYVITDHREITSQTRIYCFAFLSFAVFSFITNVFQHYHFGIMGESLTKRVREILFGKIITFEIEWFDQENNSSGSLCSRLATDAAMVRTLITDRLSMLAQNISSATLAVVLGALLSWKLALVAIAMQPFIIGAFYTKAIMMKSMSRKLLKAQNNSSELASEAVANHRIITAFYSQEKILKLHELTQISSTKESRKQSWYAGLGLSISQFLTAANAALIFWYGGKLLYQKQITYKHLFQTFFILVSTGRIIAETGSMTSDLSKGTSALKSIFVILKRKSKIDIDDSDEQGSHSELLAKEENGAYFSLVKFQQLATIGQDVIDHDQARPSG